MDNNINKQKLFDAIGQIGKNDKLSQAVAKKDFDSILGALDESQASELKKLMSDKAATERLLNSPQAQAIMKALKKNG